MLLGVIRDFVIAIFRSQAAGAASGCRAYFSARLFQKVASAITSGSLSIRLGALARLPLRSHGVQFEQPGDAQHRRVNRLASVGEPGVTGDSPSPLAAPCRGGTQPRKRSYLALTCIPLLWSHGRGHVGI